MDYERDGGGRFLMKPQRCGVGVLDCKLAIASRIDPNSWPGKSFRYSQDIDQTQ